MALPCIQEKVLPIFFFGWGGLDSGDMGASTYRCTEYDYKFGNCLFVILNFFLVHLFIRFKVPLKLAVSFCCQKTVSGIVNKFCYP